MKKIKFYREKMRLTQHELAEATGIKRWKIQLLECGHEEASKAEKKALNRVLVGEREQGGNAT